MTDQVKAPKTLAQQLADAEARVAKIKQLILSEALVNRVAAGQDVEFSFGRGEKARTLRGEIAGIKEADEETPRRLAKIVVGTGFDATPYKVAVADITRNYTIEAEDAAAASEGTDPLAAD